MAAPYVPFALGALAGAVLAIAAPSISRNAQPALKDVIRTALVLAHQIQVKAVEFVETLEDTYAEARLEAQAGFAAAPAVTAPRAAAPASKRATARKTRASARKPAKRMTRGAAAEANANA